MTFAGSREPASTLRKGNAVVVSPVTAAACTGAGVGFVEASGCTSTTNVPATGEAPSLMVKSTTFLTAPADPVSRNVIIPLGWKVTESSVVVVAEVSDRSSPTGDRKSG